MGFDSLTGTYKVVHVSRISKENPAEEELLVTQLFVLGTSSWREINTFSSSF